jgi:hypothetical protein
MKQLVKFIKTNQIMKYIDIFEKYEKSLKVQTKPE